MRWVILLSLFILFMGCEKSSNPLISQKEALANEVTIKAANRLKKEKDLRPCGFGGGAMYEIRMLALSFNYYHDLSLEEGRELLLYAVDTFLEEINSNEEIKPYLLNYPFGPKNVEIRIFPRNQNGSSLTSEQFCWITAVGGDFQYNLQNPGSEKTTIAHKETYQEALEKFSHHTLNQSIKNSLEEGVRKAEK